MELEKLISDCLANDRQAQKTFYMLTSDRLMNISRRYANNIDDAKDILQNAYISIFKNLKTFDFNKGELDSWLTKITINEALQLLRRKSKFSIKDKLGSKEQFNQLSTPEAINRLNAEDILGLVHKLPDGYKMIFNLKVVEGYSHKEIAAVLKITESTSRSQLTRAKRMLQALLIEQKKAELC